MREGKTCMEPGDKRRTRGHQRSLGPDEISHAVGDLRIPLTVLHGYTQLLQRRIRQGRILEAYACLDGLASIEQAAQAMEAKLRSLDEMMQTRKHAPDES
jgi:signal transduction histidine kinase